MDETTLKVLEGEKGRAHLGYLWAVFDPINKLPFFFYQPGRNVSLRRRPSCSIPDDPYLCILGIRVLVPPGLPGFYPSRVSSFVASVLSVG